nr:ribonuclease H-like domain-containing protein [Tanacetum cinerariifolium]
MADRLKNFGCDALVQLHCWPNCLLHRPSPLLIPATPTGTPADPTSPVLAAAVRSSAGNLCTVFNQRLFPAVYVGDGNSIPVINTGHCTIPSAHRPLHLHNVLVTHNIIKNLISARPFTHDNNCTIKIDAFGFFLKDFWTRHIRLRCDSSNDLYPVTKPSPLPTAFVTTSSSTWHQRLGHLGDDVLRSLSTPLAGPTQSPGPTSTRPPSNSQNGHTVTIWLKKDQEKDKIGSKPDKNGKRGEAGKSRKQLQ